MTAVREKHFAEIAGLVGVQVNNKAMEVRKANVGYPLFKEFVDFALQDADLACDPISSIQALNSVESKKHESIHEAKPFKQRHYPQTQQEQHPIMRLLQKNKTCPHQVQNF